MSDWKKERELEYERIGKDLYRKALIMDWWKTEDFDFAKAWDRYRSKEDRLFLEQFRRTSRRLIESACNAIICADYHHYQIKEQFISEGDPEKIKSRRKIGVLKF